MKAFKQYTLLLLCLGLLGWAVSPVLAHCGKCPEDAKEIVKQMDAGKVTAASMLAAAEAHAKGKAVGMSVVLDKGKMDADVFVQAGEKVQAVAIGGDGKAGKMDEAKGMTGMAAVVQAMDAAKLTMGAVVAAAETHSKGKALAVTAKAEGGKASFEVFTLAGEKLQKVSVDAAGKATAMAEADSLPGASAEKPKPKGG